jgi:hypothetical protein
MFKVAGVPMVENCIAGYNSCMFAYGQVGYMFHILVSEAHSQSSGCHSLFHFKCLCLQNYLLLLDWQWKNTHDAW